MMRRHLIVVAGALLLSFGFAEGQQQPPPKVSPPEAKRAGEQPPKSPRKRVVTDLSGFDLLEAKKVEKQTLVVGATRGLPQPIALAPRLGKIYGLNPVLAWSCKGDATRFNFVLSDDAQKELFRAEVVGTEYRYPPTAPRLEPGKTYFWTVELASKVLGPNPSAPAGFLVISSSQRQEIEQAFAQVKASDPYESGLARARVFTDHRLWYDAIAAYTDLIARFPDRAELYEQRGMIYAQLDATQSLAEQDFSRADELQATKKPAK